MLGVKNYYARGRTRFNQMSVILCKINIYVSVFFFV